MKKRLQNPGTLSESVVYGEVLHREANREAILAGAVLGLAGPGKKISGIMPCTVTAEYFVKTEGRGRTVDEWKPRPEQPDNHWLDCLVGAAGAASMQGALLFGTDLPITPKHERVSFRQMQQKKKQ